MTSIYLLRQTTPTPFFPHFSAYLLPAGSASSCHLPPPCRGGDESGIWGSTTRGNSIIKPPYIFLPFPRCERSTYAFLNWVGYRILHSSKLFYICCSCVTDSWFRSLSLAFVSCCNHHHYGKGCDDWFWHLFGHWRYDLCFTPCARHCMQM